MEGFLIYSVMEDEIWKDIEGYDGWYQVSNKGRVRSWLNTARNRRDKPRVLKQQNHYGVEYVSVRLYSEGGYKHETVHRLVIDAFIGKAPGEIGCGIGKYQVNHKNGVKDDNRAENLEWVTQKENQEHSWANGREATYGAGKLTENEVLDIRNAYRLGCFTQKELGEAYNVCARQINVIVNRKAWAHI